jgi:C_GCAxxG_C_C family probable redox protein
MNSNDSIRNLFDITGRKEFCRRSFIAKTAGCTALLSLLSFVGIRKELLAAEGNQSKDEIIKGLETKAAKFMSLYGSCAKSTFASLNEQFELKADAIVSAVMPFTGGIAGKGETCGAVSGGIFAIGLFFECMKQNENKPSGSSMRFGGLFFDRFKNEFGSTRCKEVMKHQFGRYIDLSNPEDMKLLGSKSQKGGGCLEVVKRGAVIAGTIILENA